MTAGAVLLADSIGKSFGGNRVLTAATLAVIPGTVTAVLGRNGSGKSTLIRIAAGWLVADYGLVTYRGERLRRARLATLAARGLFYLPERSLLCPDFTLRQHFGALAARFPRSAREWPGAARRLHLEGLLDRSIVSLSGGERRRADIAVALARQPDCLLADEPFQGVEPLDAELLCLCFRELAGRGTAIAITGHEVPVLLGVADLVVWQTAGTTHPLGTPAQAWTRHQFAREYLGTLA